eukprot:TRINITY_DN5560_c0_g1_i1.p1 TRINITY_DN5560_c0_g1~~TRINITY_DN5560_c0_g1_i1.p1  ORF type:complete len:169 (-),score=45.42 TRINITY_DN5560_c0_g1_i1:78-584(-)
MAAPLLSVLADAALPTPPSAAFFAYMGVTSAVVFSGIGASYGTAKSGVGVAAIGVHRPDLIMKSVITVIMAGMVGLYGLIIGILLSANITPTGLTEFQGFAYLGSGLSCGLSAMAAGMCLGIVGDAGVRGNAQQEKLFVGMILMMVFAEALGLYGLIVALIVAVTAKK